MEDALILFIIFASAIAFLVVIGTVIYFVKRLEHKQILAAIEKGVPLSELVRSKDGPVGPACSPAWIKHLCGGILVLFIAFGFLLREMREPIFVTFVLLGVAVSLIVRAVLYRKYYLKNQSVNQNDAQPNKTSA